LPPSSSLFVKIFSGDTQDGTGLPRSLFDKIHGCDPDAGLASQIEAAGLIKIYPPPPRTHHQNTPSGIVAASFWFNDFSRHWTAKKFTLPALPDFNAGSAFFFGERQSK
jgi:hypothetical protein